MSDSENQSTDTQNLIAELSKLGYFYLKDDRLDEAEEKFKKILDYDNQNTYALVGLGDVARKKGNFQDAVEYYKLCLEHHEENNYALFGLADSYKALKMFVTT